MIALDVVCVSAPARVLVVVGAVGGPALAVIAADQRSPEVPLSDEHRDTAARLSPAAATGSGVGAAAPSSSDAAVAGAAIASVGPAGAARVRRAAGARVSRASVGAHPSAPCAAPSTAVAATVSAAHDRECAQ